MSEELAHHGILGQRWGIRRTPAELGHPTGGGSKGSSDGGEKKQEPKKTPGQSPKSSTSMSDDELRERINRMNMEEQYDNLVARRKAKNTSLTKKLLAEAVENLGRKALGVAVDSLITKISNKGDKFDIDEFKNADINGMDKDTIAAVAKWYENANKITTYRSKLEPPSQQSST